MEGELSSGMHNLLFFLMEWKEVFFIFFIFLFFYFFLFFIVFFIFIFFLFSFFFFFLLLNLFFIIFLVHEQLGTPLAAHCKHWSPKNIYKDDYEFQIGEMEALPTVFFFFFFFFFLLSFSSFCFFLFL